MSILVTGATGRLGRPLAEALGPVRKASRNPRSDGDWVRLDLATGEGLDDALKDVETVVHCASSPYWRTARTDVEGTKHLVAAAEKAGVRHLLYISIVGVDRVPMAYYRHKLAAEEAIRAGRVPFTILRATQFHDFAAWVFAKLAFLPGLLFVPRVLMNPVDVSTVVERMCDLTRSEPCGRAPDLGGPETLWMPAMAVDWLEATGSKRIPITLPAVGAGLRAVRDGALCTTAGHGRTWEDYLGSLR